MNIYTQLCGLAIMATILFFYRRQPTMGLSSERHFRTTIYAILGCVLLDIASCYFIVHSNRFSETVVFLICKLYLLSLQVVSFSVLFYTIADVFEYYGSKHEKMLGNLYQLVCVIGMIITVYLPIYTYYDGVKLYSYGPATTATYIFASFYIFTTIISTVVLKHHIKPKKTYMLLLWMAIWSVAAIVQFLNPKILIVSYASCIGALIMYFELENPQGSLSRRTGHFSSAVIRDYFDFLYQTRKSFSVMMISFRTVADSANENKLLRTTISKLSEFLFTVDTAKVFDTAEGYFVLVFENMDFVESTKFRINTYFQSIQDNPDVSNAITLLRPFYTIVPNSNISSNADELLLLLSNFIPSDRNKLSGNEVIVNNEIMATVRHGKVVEKMVVEAMETDRIEVHYQPIFDIANNKFTTAEALVRIRLGDDSLIYPDEFIPIVEASGRIIPLSDTIYRKALSFLKSYHIERLGIEHIELNLSVKQGENPLFVTRFLEMLTEYNIPAEFVNLEITETNSIHSQESLFENMKKLEEVGLSFSLDDFGSGSSNLNYIIDMPVAIVKLDKHLTDEYFVNQKAKAIVKTVIEMAHSMGIKIIAEGIETAESLEEMKSLGVDYIQGFYFSRPLPEHEFLKFIQQHNL